MYKRQVFNVDGYFDDLESMIKKAFREGFMREGSDNLYKAFDETSALLDYFD